METLRVMEEEVEWARVVREEFVGTLNTTRVEVWPRPPEWRDGDEGVVAICSSVKDQVFDLPEWFRHHYYHLGIRSFYIFDDGTVPPLADQLTDFELGIPRSAVTFIYQTNSTRVQMQQMHAFEECVRMFGSQHSWMALIDPDEFLEMVDPSESLQSFLESFDSSVGVVGVQWAMHNSHGEKKRPARGSCRRTFTSCVRDPDPETREPMDNAHVKAIARTRDFVQMDTPHSVKSKGKTVGEDGGEMGVTEPLYWRLPVTRERIALHHYAVKSREEYEEKMVRGSGMGNHKGEEFWHNVDTAESVICDSLAKFSP